MTLNALKLKILHNWVNNIRIKLTYVLLTYTFSFLIFKICLYFYKKYFSNIYSFQKWVNSAVLLSHNGTTYILACLFLDLQKTLNFFPQTLSLSKPIITTNTHGGIKFGAIVAPTLVVVQKA